MRYQLITYFDLLLLKLIFFYVAGSVANSKNVSVVNECLHKTGKVFFSVLSR